MDINKEDLENNIAKHFFDQLLASLEETDLDEDEKAANLVLARKKIMADSKGIADLVFQVSK